MKVPASRRSRGMKFNIISMIDIFFLLIIFFITAARFVHSESQHDVQLPHAAASEESPQPQRLMLVTITADRTLLIGPKKVDAAAIEQQILANRGDDPSRFEVRIRADRNVPFRDIEPILLACARAGVTNVQFPVFPQ